MGDCLLLTAPVRALKEEFPGFRVTVLVESRFAACFDGNPDFTEILIADGKSSTALKLFRKRFHAIVNLHGGPTSLVYSCLAWGKRIGGEHYRGVRLYNGRFPRRTRQPIQCNRRWTRFDGWVFGAKRRRRFDMNLM
jgi:ADP-heptose:LPS heptosyltransferase